MLRRLAQWRGSRIAVLWVALVVIEVGIALAIRVPEDGATHKSDSTGFTGNQSVGELSGNDSAEELSRRDRDSLPPETEAAIQAFENRIRSDAEEVGPFQSLIDNIFAPVWQSLGDTILSPDFFLLLAPMAVLFYGPPLALVVLTVLWLFARWRYGRPGTAPFG